jgi:hypothetical protein
MSIAILFLVISALKFKTGIPASKAGFTVWVGSWFSAAGPPGQDTYLYQRPDPLQGFDLILCFKYNTA